MARSANPASKMARFWRRDFEGFFSVGCLLFYLIVVATALLARDHAAVAAIDRSGHRAAVSFVPD